MAVTIKDLRFSIYLNNADAKKSAIEMQTQIQKLGNEMDALSASGENESAAYKEKKITLSELDKEYKEITNSISKKQNALDALAANGQAETAGYKKKEEAIAELNVKLLQNKSASETLNSEIKKMIKDGTHENEVFREKKRTLDTLKVSFEKTKLEAGLLGMSMKELRKLSITMKGDLSRMVPGSQDWKKLEKDIKVVDGRIGELKGTAKSTEGSLSKMANGFNKYFAMGTAFFATITGMSFAFRSMAEDVAKMDDVYSDVMKTTNLTKDQVVGLNEEFKKMDTRTSRDSLNLLARDAGKLGIEGTQNILDFVDAGNQINVALGEDLGEDAIKNIGKMVGVYKKSTKELQDLGLKEQMLAVGSAINDLGAASSADEGYLVEFAGRMGGVATQAKLGMDAVLGFGSVMDQNMQQVEMSSSALSKFIMKMMGDPAKFAKLAGLEVKGFTKLLDTDANAAIKKVLVALNDQGGFKALVPIFEDMQMDGVRATQVLATLASNITELDAAQKVANKSMIAGTSVTNEYGIKNNNLAAKLDKAKKAFTEVSLQLGESLNPVLLKSTNLLTYMVRGLVAIIPYLGTIGKFMLIVGGYTAAYNGNLLLNNILLKEGIGIKIKDLFLKAKDAIVLEGLIIKEAIHAATIGKTTVATKAAAIAQVLWNNAVKANPLGLALGILTTIAGAIWLVTSRMGEATEAQKAQINIQKKVNEQYGDQESKIAMLVGVLNNEKIALGERKKALDELKAIVPGYHADLTAEGKLINNNTSAVKDYLVQLEKEIRMQAAKDEYIELIKKKRLQDKEVVKASSNFDKTKKDNEIGVVGGGDAGIAGAAAKGDMMVNSKKKLNDELEKQKTLDIAILEIQKEMETSTISKPSTGPKKGDKKLIDDIWCTWDGSKWVPDKVGGGGGGTGDGGDPNKEKLKALDDELLAEQVKLKKQEQTKDKFDAGMLALDVKFLTKKRNLYKKDSAEYNAFESQLLDIDRKKKQDANAHALESFTDMHQAKLDFITSTDALERIRLEEEFTTQDKYDSDLLALDLTTAQSRYDVAKNYADEVKDYVFSSEEEKTKITDAANKEVIASDKDLRSAKKAIKRQELADKKSFEDEAKRLREKYGLDEERSISKRYKKELKLLKSHIKDKKELEKATSKLRLKTAGEYADALLAVANGAAELSSKLQESQILAVDNKYAAELKAAEGNADATNAIEEKKEEEKKQIKKKYADVDFAINVAQIIASTALGITKALEIPPPFGEILAGIVGASGIVQLGLANQQRQSIKNLWTGGYTGDGGEREPAGVVHKGEFVANAKAVRNPKVKKFLDVFNTAQMNGTIHMLNTTQILEKVRADVPTGKYSGGGYTQSASGAVGSVNSDVAMALVNENTKAMNRLNEHLDSGIVARSVIAGDNGSYKKTEDYKKMRANVSRG